MLAEMQSMECCQKVHIYHLIQLSLIREICIWRITQAYLGGAMILNTRAKFIMRKGSFSSYNLCVCPGNHAVVKGMWKHEVSDNVKDKLFPDKRYDKDIVVEEDVWIGINVTLLNGAHIGRGSIIGAGCIVSGDIPPYAVVVGNPCRVVKFIFTPEEILEHEKKLYPVDNRLSFSVLQKNYSDWKAKLEM